MRNINGSISKEISSRIKVARTICILSLIYIHSPPYNFQRSDYPLGNELIIQILKYVVGHSSVPLLSIISAYLMVKFLKDKPWPNLIRSKIYTLIIPLILWNVIGLSKMAVMDKTLPNLVDLPNDLLGLTTYPAVLPLYFLRDMFVCALLFPVFFFFARKAPYLLLLGLSTVAVVNWNTGIFINNQIPLFFAIGCSIALMPDAKRYEVALQEYSTLIIPLASCLLTLLLLYPYCFGDTFRATESGRMIENLLLVLNRIGGSILFWYATSMLVHSKVGNKLIELERFIFFVFCFHPFAISVVWILSQKMGAEVGNYSHLALFVLSPALVLAVSLAAVGTLLYIAPKLLGLLLGGRAPSKKQFKQLMSGPLQTEGAQKQF